jgi:hypothetical protein
MLTIALPGCITRPHACAIQYEPLRLTSMTFRNSSGVSRVAGTAVATPALLINTSTRPNFGHRGVDELLALAWVGHVGPVGVRPTAGLLDQGGGRGQLFRPARPQHQIGAGLGERLSEGDAQSGGGAGDDGDLVVKTE